MLQCYTSLISRCNFLDIAHGTIFNTNPFRIISMRIFPWFLKVCIGRVCCSYRGQSEKGITCKAEIYLRCNVFQPVRVEYGYYIELLLTTWNCTESSTHFSVTQSVDLEETTIKYESSLGFNQSQIQMHTYWFSPGSLNSPTTTEATRAVFATEPPWKHWKMVTD